MPMIWAAGISAAAGLAGGAMQQSNAKDAARAANEAAGEMSAEQRAWASQEASTAREFNYQEAARTREWQTYMADTAHRRQVADLRAAGLNPILSASKGMGSATPSGATASASAPSGSSAQAHQAQSFDILGPAVARALETISTLADTTKKQAETKEVEARTPIYEQQVEQIKATTANVLEDTKFKTAMIGKTEQETEKVRFEVKRVIEEIYQTYWSALSNRQDVFNKEKTGAILGVEARTMQGLEDKHITQILKAHPLVSEFGDLIKALLPTKIISNTLSRGPKGTTSTHSAQTISHLP